MRTYLADLTCPLLVLTPKDSVQLQDSKEHVNYRVLTTFGCPGTAWATPAAVLGQRDATFVVLGRHEAGPWHHLGPTGGML